MANEILEEAKIFTPVSSFPLKLSLPMIYPDRLFTFYLRVQMVKDAEIAHRSFVMLPDDQKYGDAWHQFDAEMLSSLAVDAPLGFPDFPLDASIPIRTRMKQYFYPDDPERREGMRFICRRAMALYFNAIQPDQYL